MRKTLLALATLCLLCLPSTAAADWPDRATYSATITDSAFSSVAINTARTFDAMSFEKYSTVLVEIEYTYSSATHVTMTCEQSPNKSKWFKVPELEDVGDATLDHEQRTWRWVTNSASANFFFEVPTRYKWLRCTIYTVNGAAGDKATVTITAGGLG